VRQFARASLFETSGRQEGDAGGLAGANLKYKIETRDEKIGS
jgi:hypothetical protein